MMHKILDNIVDLTLPDYIVFNIGITRGHYYNILTIPSTRIDRSRHLIPSIPLPSNSGTPYNLQLFVHHRSRTLIIC